MDTQKPPHEKAGTSGQFLLAIKIIGSLVSLVWITLFSAGLLVNSQPYRDALGKQFDISMLVISILTYTPTNIAFLCLFAALVGGCASKLVSVKAPEFGADLSKSDSYMYMTENPLSSMLRGLVVYFLFLAGVYVSTDAPFAAPTPGQFARAAGSVSLLSFAVGYDPTIFRSIIGMAGRLKKE